jgi:hypothetical protein
VELKVTCDVGQICKTLNSKQTYLKADWMENEEGWEGGECLVMALDCGDRLFLLFEHAVFVFKPYFILRW